MKMSDSFAIIKGIGELAFRTIYGFYDEPLLFSCISLTGSLYLMLRQPSDDPVWLGIEISDNRLALLESNKMETYTAFREPENGFLYRVTGDQDYFECEVLYPDSITNDMLPFPGEYLDYHGEIAFNREEIDVVAKKEKCTVVELSFEQDDGHSKEISCAALSEALNNIQMLVYSLAYKEEKTYGQFPKSIREQHELKVTDTFAASFGIQLKSSIYEDEQKQREAEDVLGRLNDLFGGSVFSDELKNTLGNESNRTIVYFNKLLRGLKKNNLGFGFTAASPAKAYNTKHLTTYQVGEVLQRITNDIEEIKEEETYEGELKGIDVERKKFTFILSNMGENIKISGRISDDIVKTSFTVPSKTRVRVETTTKFDKLTGEEKYSFLLLEVIGN